MRLLTSIAILALLLPGSGAAQTAKGDPAKAKKSFERALQLQDTGKMEDAFKACTEAVEADPDFAPAWRERGKIRWLLGETEYGVADLNRSLALDPNDAEAWTLRGDILASSGKLEEALKDFDKAVTFGKENSHLYAARAVTLVRLFSLVEPVSGRAPNGFTWV